MITYVTSYPTVSSNRTFSENLLKSNIGFILLIIAVSILIFIIGRVVALWYWRVNEIIHELKKINDNLSVINISPNSAKVSTGVPKKEENKIEKSQ